MPYITGSRREIAWEAPQNVGELCYVLTETCRRYLEDKGGESFGRFAEVLGALAATEHELYRRRIGPYEDECIKRNGDLWT